MASEVKLRPGTSFLSWETVGHTECVGRSLLYLYGGSEDTRPTDVTGLLQTPSDTEKLLKTPLQRRKNSIYPTSRMAHGGSSGTRAFARPLCAQRNLRAAACSCVQLGKEQNEHGTWSQWSQRVPCSGLPSMAI